MLPDQTPHGPEVVVLKTPMSVTGGPWVIVVVKVHFLRRKQNLLTCCPQLQYSIG